MGAVSSVVVSIGLEVTVRGLMLLCEGYTREKISHLHHDHRNDIIHVPAISFLVGGLGKAVSVGSRENPGRGNPSCAC